MRTLHNLALASLLAGGVAACDNGYDPMPVETVPLAGVRFVNAVPDTMAFDYRFVDFLTNAGFFDAAFRASQAVYAPVETGTHTFKVFLSSTDVTVASQYVNETTHNFVEGGRYTVIHTGYMRSGGSPAAAVTVVEDNAATPGAGKVALRALNLAGNLAALDVFVGTTTGSGLPAATATWTNLAYNTFTPYVDFDTTGLRVAATATGTATPLLVANTAAPAGAAAISSPLPQSAIAGVRIAGSAMTIVILPRSVAGSMAPQTSAYTVPAFAFLTDRRPPD